MSVDKLKSEHCDVNFYEQSIFDCAVTLATAAKVNIMDYLRLVYYIVGYRSYRKRNNI